MKGVLVLLFVFTLSDAIITWDEWIPMSVCDRKCSETTGRAIFTRTCLNCVGRDCNSDSPVVCDSRCANERSEECKELKSKFKPCYNGSNCEGEGVYVGEWSSWQPKEPCPTPHSVCRGVKSYLTRTCQLPAKYRDRSRAFKCPEGIVDTVRYCPCGVANPTPRPWPKRYLQPAVVSPPGRGPAAPPVRGPVVRGPVPGRPGGPGSGFGQWHKNEHAPGHMHANGQWHKNEHAPGHMHENGQWHKNEHGPGHMHANGQWHKNEHGPGQMHANGQWHKNEHGPGQMHGRRRRPKPGYGYSAYNNDYY